MPELPEVETTRRGVGDAVVGRSITAFDLREPRLRAAIEARRTRLEYLATACLESLLLVWWARHHTSPKRARKVSSARK